MTICRVHIARWVSKCTDTPSEYVIFIAFPLQKWLGERALILRVCIHCLSFFYIYKSVYRQMGGNAQNISCMQTTEWLVLKKMVYIVTSVL